MGWKEVRIVVNFYDGSSHKSIAHTISKADVEQGHRNRLLQAAEQEGVSEEQAEEMRKQAEEYAMSDAEFQERVFQAATDLATNPLQVPGPTGHTVRILPPWAVRNVDIEVLDPAPVGLVLPN